MRKLSDHRTVSDDAMIQARQNECKKDNREHRLINYEKFKHYGETYPRNHAFTSIMINIKFGN